MRTADEASVRVVPHDDRYADMTRLREVDAPALGVRSARAGDCPVSYGRVFGECEPREYVGADSVERVVVRQRLLIVGERVVGLTGQ